ncbi:gustatory receptor for sugar taste 43a-like [Vespula maculifrons]|uniref:Gustatory receptor n=1 Tax=Vespula maculifrons TaxID=7453 RepID=A0ABD2CNW2_VESMC
MKFAQLNGILQSMLTTTTDCPQHKRVLRMKDNWENDSSLSTIYRTYKAHENFMKLKRVKQIHLELIKCARIINEAYELQIFVSMSTCVVFIIALLHQIYSILIAKEYVVIWRKEIHMYFYWIFYYVFKIFAVSNICETTMTEILNFVYQLVQNHLTFTVCGFYDIDHTFLYSAIGSIITYLVVFIEFGEIPKEFQRSVMPLVIANSIFCTGLLEYFVDRTIRTIGFFYAICCILYYTILFFILKDVMNILFGYKKTRVAGILTKFTFINNVFMYVIIIFTGFLKRKQIKSFVQQLEICTQGIDEMIASKDYSSLFRYQCIVSIILFFATSGLIAIDIFWTSKINCDYSLKIWFYFYDNYPLIVTMIDDFTFVFWIRYIKMKFAQLNGILQSMLTTTTDCPQHKRVLRMKDNWENDSSLSTIYRTYKAHENLIKLKRVRQIHLEMIKCARIINEAYGLPILLSMSTSIIYIISLLYNFYVISITTNYNHWINEFFAHFYWISFFMMKIITINNICETTITEIRNFIFQQVHNGLTFTACGLFDLGHTFIYSVIGLITTYLIIFIQIGGKPKIWFNNTNYNLSSMI